MAAESATFVSAPPGLTINLTDGTRLPVVAFRVDGYKLVPHYIEKDGSVGEVAFPVTVTAAWTESVD